MAERRRAIVLTALLLALLGLTPAAFGTRVNITAADTWRPGSVYTGDFPDPTVWRVGARYYAASTTVASLTLPVLTSSDLRTWKPAGTGDAMPAPASWAEKRRTTSGRTWAGTWAPSVVRLTRADGSFEWVLAYSQPRASDGMRCIGVARSTSPAGPYVDRSHSALVCGAHGSIDPQLFLDRGRLWLLLKATGSPPRILVRQLTSTAARFAPGSTAHLLLTPVNSWEGHVVENPAMIRYRGRLYLFWSGNDYWTSRYSTGYATCSTPTGRCVRRGRLLASGSVLSGPGGATPFVDTAGGLRLGYHAWRTGSVGYPDPVVCRSTSTACAARRLYVSRLVQHTNGLLTRRSG